MRAKYIKNGNPDWFTFFNKETFDTMTPDQQRHWTLASDDDLEGIPDEVLNFMPVDLNLPPLPDEKKDPVINGPAPVEVTVTVPIKVVTTPEIVKPLTEEEEVKQIRAKLKELGIKFAYNAKIENLRKKLSDANNSK